MNEDKEIREALDRLAVLAPDAAEAPTPPVVALAQIKKRIGRQPLPATHLNRSRNKMSNRRIVAAGLTFVLALALLMAFPSVRAAAAFRQAYRAAGGEEEK